jgi:uncharacterized protein YlxW (UPF0749 family)
MNVFTANIRHQPWVWQVTSLCFVLGLLVTVSLQTVSSIRQSGAGTGRVGGPPLAMSSLSETVRKREKEISDLREKQTQLENTMAHGNDRLKTLNDELQKTKMLAGLTAVTGPGIILTLNDSARRPPSNRAFEQERYNIHDYDLQTVVNELGASGAEALSINGQRFISRTSIRCVGPTILVNAVPMTPPYSVQAIGDPITLAGALNLPGGYLDNLRQTDPGMFRLEKRALLSIPDYTGSTEVRYMRPADTEGSSRRRRR